MESAESSCLGQNRSITTSENQKKEEGWQQVVTEFSQVTDRLGQPIDHGIFNTVVGLNMFGIHTSQSCEGHLERGIAAPWVEIRPLETPESKQAKADAQQAMKRADSAERMGEPEERVTELYKQARRLQQEAQKPMLEEMRKAIELLKEFYQERNIAYDRMLTLHGSRLESQSVPLQEIVSPEVRKQNLDEYQEEMKAFADFLRQKYMSS